MNRINKFLPIASLIVSVITLAYLVIGAYAAYGICSDFPEYYASAKSVWTGTAKSAYIPDQTKALQQQLFPELRGRFIQLYLPPPGLVILAPLGLLPTDCARLIWKLLLTGSLFGSLLLLSRIYGLAKVETVWFITFSTLFAPSMESLRIDQLAPILLLLLVGALKFSRSENNIATALCLTGLMLKPQQLLPILVYCLGAKKIKLLAWFTLFVGLLFLGSFLMIGVDGYNAFRELVGLSFTSDGLCPTFRGQLLRLFPHSHMEVLKVSSAVMAITLLAIGAIAFWFSAKKTTPEKVDPLLASPTSNRWFDYCLLVAVPLGLFTSMHCFIYDSLLLIPTAFAISRKPFRTQLSPWMSASLLIIAILFQLPAEVTIYYDYLFKGGLWNPFVAAMILLIVVCLIAAIRANSAETVQQRDANLP